MDQSAPEIQAVLFDADGVVQRQKPDWLSRLKQLCGDPDRVEQFLTDVFDAELPCLVGADDFESSLTKVLKQWNSAATASEALNIFTMIDPDDTVFELIRALRSNGTLVALATNQQQYRANYMLNELGYADEFDQVFCSCHLGHAKPSANYFMKALEILDLPAASALFIDDHEENVEAAKKVGLHAARYRLDEGIAAMVRLLNSYGLPITAHAGTEK
jgi:putative hydrolase of the HAD superfamily